MADLLTRFPLVTPASAPGRVMTPSLLTSGRLQTLSTVPPAIRSDMSVSAGPLNALIVWGSGVPVSPKLAESAGTMYVDPLTLRPLRMTPVFQLIFSPAPPA